MKMKIDQHIYTRARRTLFQQSEGYGTVAKTDGLSETFIKEKIHPYCVYLVSPKLQNYTVCPIALTLVHYPCGRMLFGRAAYKEKDFTGQRATFFAHNYIFPPQMVDGVLRDFGKLRQVEFLTEYDAGQENRLPQLVNFTGVCNCRVAPAITEFDYILQYIAASVRGKQKTYIIVPVDPPQMHDYIWDFLTWLYPRLSDELRHQLGFCTYARGPVNKKGLHLIFLEKGTVADSKFANDFVIDLNNNCVTAPPMTTPAHAATMNTNFPQESEFWHIRTPHRRAFLLNQGREWIDAKLEKLSLFRLATIPGSFIIRGKGFDQPELYVILGILKTCAGAISTRTPLDLRYLLGSYSLSPQNHFRVVQNLRRLYQDHITPANYENIVFLFRARGRGRVDIAGLEAYLAKFACGPECKEAVMLTMR